MGMRVFRLAVVVALALSTGGAKVFWRTQSTDMWVNFKTFGLTIGVFAFFMAFDQLGVARTIVTNAFIILLGTVGLAAALAFGILDSRLGSLHRLKTVIAALLLTILLIWILALASSSVGSPSGMPTRWSSPAGGRATDSCSMRRPVEASS